MKKVLLATDGKNFSPSAFDFSQKLNALEHILLTGIFLPSPELTYSFAGTSPYVPLIEEYGAASVEPAVEKFLEACVNSGMECTVHKNLNSFALSELKRETRFADLMVVPGENFFDDIKITGPDETMGNVLHISECPVIIIPENAAFPESLILTYDGSPSSVFSIKSFACLFPYLCHLPAKLVYCSRKEEAVPEEQNITELVNRHFPNLSVEQLEADPKKYLTTWMQGYTKPILIAGAYGRSGFSRLFRQSFISEVLNEHKIPVFTVHMK
ncbi:hypothetical protein SAMN05444266_104156 [Chitinophaga jiangningensis]|uniref:Nucleotide-binding universal stress protein, UspA family n=1 Tax=Chitinophaga jiangningensis TaxID=1419482 RepID=A0A1M7C1E2_9BACT|nr:universal stress protein [Chitinophaga jiangningensis]SHL61024.1 hypothetical protein SAMN05444266_104156 [Chitinophaga jiangningensis]